MVFGLGTKGSWDSAEIGCPVVKRYLSDDEERWYMWYYGRSQSKSPVVDDSIGLAVSSNGIHWERGGDAAKSASDVGLVMNCSSDWWAFDTQAIRPSEVVIMSSAKKLGEWFVAKRVAVKNQGFLTRFINHYQV